MIVNDSFGIAKTHINRHKNSHNILQRAFLRQAPRPNEKSFGRGARTVFSIPRVYFTPCKWIQRPFLVY